MRIPKLKLSLAAALVVAGLASAVAVGAPAGASPIAPAAAKSSSASSVKFDFTVSFSGGTLTSGKITLGGSGALDSKHKAADVKLDLSSLAPLLSGVTNGAQVPKTIEAIVVDNAVYLNYPALAKQLKAPGKSWVKLDLSKVPKSLSGGVNPTSASGITPQHALALLRSQLAVHKVGTDAHGTHYHGSFNLSALVQLVPKSQQASLKASLAKSGVTKIPFDVWVGKQGFLSRLALSLSVRSSTKGQAPVKIAIALNLHDYNSPVHISPPPANQTVDGSSLLGSVAGAVGGGR